MPGFISRRNPVLLFLLIFFGLSASANAIDKHWIGPAGGSFADNANWSTGSGGGNDTTAPVNTDVAIFDNGDDDNCVIDSDIDVLGINIQNGYDGTLTQNNGFTITVGASNWTQADGTFAGGNSAIDIGGDFSLSGGTFTSTNAALQVSGAFNHSGGTFTHNSGRVVLDNTADKTLGLTGGTTFNDLTLNDGLIRYWKFDDGAGAGTLKDYSGYGLDGTLHNFDLNNDWKTTAAPTQFTNPGSLLFTPGNDTNVTLPAAASLSGPGDFTISAWIKCTAPGPADHFIIAQRDPQNPQGFRQWIFAIRGPASGSQGKIRWHVGSTQFFVTSTVRVDDNEWHHVVGIRDGTDGYVYIDGKQRGFVAGGAPKNFDGTITTSIGKNNRDNHSQFDGQIDELRIYNRQLSVQEIQALAIGTHPEASAATTTLNAALDVNGDLTINSGTLDVSGTDFSVSLAGSWLNNGGVFNARGGTVTLDGNAGSGMTLQSGGQRFFNLSLSGAGETWTLADRLNIDGQWSMVNGTMDVSTSDCTVRAGTVSQSGGTIQPRSGTVVLTSGSDQNLGVTDTLNNLRIEDATENGLAGYWKLDSLRGTSARDFSGGGHDGTLTNTPFWQDDTTGTTGFDNAGCILFDGTDDFVTVADHDDLDMGTGDFSACFWMRRSAAPAGTETLLSEDDGASAGYGIELNTGGRIQAFVRDAGGTITATDDSAVVTDDSWTHVAVIFDRDGNISRYVNGTVSGTEDDMSARSATLDNAVATVLGATAVPGQYYGGYLDDVRIYTRALSADEVANLAAGRYAGGVTDTASFSLMTGLTVGGTISIDSGTLNCGAQSLSAAALAVLSGGGLTGSTGNLTVTGDLRFFASATFDANGGTVVLGGTGDQTLTPGGVSFNHLTLNNTGAAGSDDIIISGSLDVDGTLIITDGDLDLNTNNSDVNTAGDVSIGANGSVTKGTGTWTFDDAAAAALNSNGQDLGTVLIDGTAKTVSLSGSTAAGTLTIAADDVLNLAGQTFSAATLVNNSILRMQGGETVSITTMDTDSGTVEVSGNGDGTTDTLNLPDLGAVDFYNLTINTAGTPDVIQASSGTAVAGNLTLSAGTLKSPGDTLSVAGNWINSGGTFDGNGGTVVLSGSSQSVSGSTTFAGLTKTTAAAATLTFENNSTQTVTGTLTLQGADGQLLSLRSDSPGTAWKLDPQGTKTLAHLDVADSDNIGSTPAEAGNTGSTDSGNNSNWYFSLPSVQFDASASSGSEAVTNVTLGLSLSRTIGATLTVDYAVTGGTATGSGSDYSISGSTLNFLSGDSTKTLAITVVDDDRDESDETVEITLSNPTGMTLGTITVHAYTISDQDTSGVTVTESGGSTAVTEGGAADSFTVALTSEPSADVTVALSADTADQVAISPSSLTFTAADWSTAQTVSVSPVDDLRYEATDTVSINYALTSSDSGYNGLAVTATSITVTDDDEFMEATGDGKDPVVSNGTAVPADSDSGGAPLLVTLTADVSSDDAIASYQWDFDGDGVTDYSSSISPTISTTYTIPGNYTAVLTTIDIEGNRAVTRVEVAVPAPVTDLIMSASPASGEAPLEVTLSLSEPLIPVQAVLWDFDGDGSTDRATEETEIVTVFRSAGEITPSAHVLYVNGTQTIVSGQVSVTAVTDPPEVNIIRVYQDVNRSGTWEASEDSLIAEDASGLDPAAILSAGVGDPIGFTAAASANQSEWAWDFNGDGRIEAKTGSGAESGTATVMDQAGVFRITVITQDAASGIQGSASVTLNVAAATGLNPRIWIAEPSQAVSISGSQIPITVYLEPPILFEGKTVDLEFYDGSAWRSLTAAGLLTAQGSSGSLRTFVLDVSAGLDGSVFSEGDSLQLRVSAETVLNTTVTSTDSGQTGAALLSVQDSGGDISSRNEGSAAVREFQTDGSGAISGQTDTGTRVDIPAGAAASGTVLRMRSFTENPVSSKLLSNGTAIRFVGVFREFKLVDASGDEVEPALPVTIQIPFSDTDDDGVVDGTDVRSSDLQIYRFTGRYWMSLAGTIRNTEEGYVGATTPGFSYFGIGVPTQAEVGAQPASGGGCIIRVIGRDK